MTTTQKYLTTLLAVALHQSSVDAITLRASSQAETTTLLNTEQFVDDGIHTCDFVHNRMKLKDQPNYEAVIENGTVWTDPTFPTIDAIDWDDHPQTRRSLDWIADFSFLKWSHMSKSYPARSGYTLFGADGVQPDAVEQGSVGNCWFLAAAAALAEVPGRFENYWLTKEYNDAGIYAINMFHMGVPITVLVDDFVPHLGSTYQTVFAKVQKQGPKATWMVILEKAYAKLMGNYAQLIGGHPDQGVSALTGFPSKQIKTSSQAAHTTWLQIAWSDVEKNVMTASSNFPFGDVRTDDNGVVYKHAYTILGAHVVQLKTPVEGEDGTISSEAKLIKVRDPWSRENYVGKWWDDDSRWDNVSQSEQDRIGKSSTSGDGVFFMDMHSFKESFRFLYINYNLSDYHRQHFMVLDDQTTAADSPGTGSICGPSCVAHSFKIKSNVNQMLYVSAHLHNERTYPLDCRPAMMKSGIIYNFGSKFPQQVGWDEGAHHFAPKVIRRQLEWDITLEFPWHNQELTKDFSLVVFSQHEDVQITHLGGLQSQDWPVQGQV